MLLFSSICLRTDAINRNIGNSVSWRTLRLVTFAFVSASMYPLFNSSCVFTQEFEWYTFTIIFLMNTVTTLLNSDHLYADVFFVKLFGKAKLCINLICVTFFQISDRALFIHTGTPITRKSFNNIYGLPTHDGISVLFIPKAVLWTVDAWVLLHGISLSIKRLFNILGLPKKNTTKEVNYTNGIPGRMDVFSDVAPDHFRIARTLSVNPG